MMTAGSTKSLLRLGWLAVCCCQAVVASPVIVSTLGQMRGMVVGTKQGALVDVYYGVPYAKPPVGKLRFKVR